MAGKPGSPPRRYFQAFDGFRGLSALAVFAWHFLKLPFGWAGVDFFFVLSGFLITGILYDSRSAEHRFRNFYIRRSLRIFPLYYAVLIAIVTFSLFRHADLTWPLLVWPLYIGNYAQLLFPHYKLQLIGPFIVGHLWSLSVEEQFYLLWPTIVYKVPDRKTLIRICLFLIVLCPFLRLGVLSLFPGMVGATDIVFRGTIFRCDSLFIGALCALWIRGPERDRVLRAGTPLCLLSGGIFIASAAVNYFLFHVTTTEAQQFWVSTYGLTALDLFAAGVLLISIDDGSWTARMLRTPVLSHFGRLTYGFYVYHALFLAYDQRIWLWLKMRGASDLQAQLGEAIVAFSLSYLVALLSYRLFERYFIALKDKYAPEQRNGPSPAAREVCVS